VVGDAQPEHDSRVLVPRRVPNPEITLTIQVAEINTVVLLLLRNSGSPGGVDRNQATRQQIRSGDIDQSAQPSFGFHDVRQRLGRARYLVAERLGGKVMSGPDRGVAATRIAGNLVAVRRGEDRVQNSAKGRMEPLNIIRNGKRIRLRSAQRKPAESNQ